MTCRELSNEKATSGKAPNENVQFRWVCDTARFIDNIGKRMSALSGSQGMALMISVAHPEFTLCQSAWLVAARVSYTDNCTSRVHWWTNRPVRRKSICWVNENQQHQHYQLQVCTLDVAFPAQWDSSLVSEMITRVRETICAIWPRIDYTHLGSLPTVLPAKRKGTITTIFVIMFGVSAFDSLSATGDDYCSCFLYDSHWV